MQGNHDHLRRRDVVVIIINNNITIIIALSAQTVLSEDIILIVAFDKHGAEETDEGKLEEEGLISIAVNRFIISLIGIISECIGSSLRVPDRWLLPQHAGCRHRNKAGHMQLNRSHLSKTALIQSSSMVPLSVCHTHYVSLKLSHRSIVEFLWMNSC